MSLEEAAQKYANELKQEDCDVSRAAADFLAGAEFAQQQSQDVLNKERGDNRTLLQMLWIIKRNSDSPATKQFIDDIFKTFQVEKPGEPNG